MTYSSKQSYPGNGFTQGTATEPGYGAYGVPPIGSAQGVTEACSSLTSRDQKNVIQPNPMPIGSTNLPTYRIEEQSSEEERRPPLPDGNSLRANREKFDPHIVWQMLLSELALQMPSATFNTWVRDTWVIAYEDGEFIIGLPNAYARDWLENRLRNKIKKALGSFIHRSVQIQFRVCPRAVSDPVDAKPVPLYTAQPVAGEMPIAEMPPSSATEQTQRDDETLYMDDLSSQPRTAVHTSGPAASATPPRPSQSPTAASFRDQGDTSSQDHHTVAGGNVAGGNVAGGNVAGGMGYESVGRGYEYRVQQDYYGDHDVLAAKIPLNGQYTFETFVVGSHNKLAHAAAEAIAERPGQSFNPLFVYGGVGLGKTHLLHSIGHRAKLQGFHMLYVSSEQFTNELIGAIRSQSTEEFRNKYRRVDILLIDDIQFISGKESTQEEFFHTFNHLHASGRQVVLSSDRPPKMLATLDDRLRSRFEGGLQTDIAQPDFETRVAILQSKAKRMAAAVDHSVLMMVAERVDSNIRELEGALNRLIVQARLMHSPLTLAVATSILDNLAPERTACEPKTMIRVIAEHFQLKAEDLCGRKRTKEIAGARQIAMFILREEHALSLPAIGELLGGRDHSTVRYGIEKVSADQAEDETLRQTLATLREKVYTPFLQ